jgi:hypothetical protein
MKYISFLISLFLITACNSTTDHNQSAETPAVKVSEMTEEKLTLVHTVFFWYKEDLSKENIEIFESALKKLSTVPAIGKFHYGPPASTEARGVVDNSFDMALNVFFKDVEAQNAYQIDPIHLAFVEQCEGFWEKVIVYDKVIK